MKITGTEVFDDWYHRTKRLMWIATDESETDRRKEKASRLHGVMVARMLRVFSAISEASRKHNIEYGERLAAGGIRTSQNFREKEWIIPPQMNSNKHWDLLDKLREGKK